MTRFEVIGKHYTYIRSISKKLTKDWEDFSHDLCEYLNTIPPDIIAIDQRGEFERFVYVVAYRRALKIKKPLTVEIWDMSIEEEEIEIKEDHPDDVEKLSRLSKQDRQVLSIFAQGASISEASRKTFIDRKTLKKLWDKARKNAQQALK